MKTMIKLMVVAASLYLAAEAVAGCSITMPAQINFAAYDTLAAGPAACQALGTNSIVVDCSIGGPNPPNPAVNPIITITAGQSGSTAQRVMKTTPPADSLKYNLFTDNLCANIWSNVATPGPNVVQFFNIKKQSPPQSASLYGNIPAAQDVFAGTYSDNLSVVVTY